MAYTRKSWYFTNSIENEYSFKGNYGARGEKRAARRKATPEQMEKQNQRNRENKMRRVIKANFGQQDYWCTLKYPQGTRKSIKEVERDFGKFLENTRKAYKRREQLFKYIYRVEVGSQGGVHIHILLNRIPGTDTDLLIKKRWKYGSVNFETLYEQGGYQRLASYIVKLPTDDIEQQMCLFDEDAQKKLVRYSSSRNLIRPKPEKKLYSRWTVARIICDGPKPQKGFYIDKSSIVQGVNPYTGMSYLHYTEVRIQEMDSGG